MVRIGIELNGIIRDINKQYLKYYVKDINPEFDEENVDLNVVDLLPLLKFKSEKAKKVFKYEDYPYELFGCAQPMSRNLHTFINGWNYELTNDNNYNLSVFSMNEDELTIQSTYFYLSKSGSRIRKVLFPRKINEVYNEFDIIITTNKDIVKNAPKGKTIILIEKNDNTDLNKYTKYHFKTLEDVIKNFNDIVKESKTNNNIFYKIKNKIRNFFKHG